MDWPRARLILICSFAVMNLLLAFFLWGGSEGQVWGTPLPNTPEHLREVRARLKEARAELKVDLPPGGSLTPLLRVRRVEPPVANLGRVYGHSVFLEAPPEAVWESLPGLVSPRHGQARLQPVVREDGTAVYPLNAQGLAARSLDLSDPEQVHTAIEPMLQVMGLLPDDAAFRRIYRDEQQRLVVEYTQMVGTTPLFTGQILAMVSPRGIERVEYFWLHVEGGRGDLKSVLPASQVLLRLAGELESASPPDRTEPIVFSAVELGYYAERPEDAQSWDVVPVWRIDVEGGPSYYMNGFTGIMAEDRFLP
jgi:hypothetical protein